MRSTTSTGARSRRASSSRRSEEHTSELQSQSNPVCRLLLEKKNTAHHDDQLQTPYCRAYLRALRLRTHAALAVSRPPPRDAAPLPPAPIELYPAQYDLYASC